MPVQMYALPAGTLDTAIIMYSGRLTNEEAALTSHASLAEETRAGTDKLNS